MKPRTDGTFDIFFCMWFWGCHFRYCCICFFCIQYKAKKQFTDFESWESPCILYFCINLIVFGYESSNQGHGPFVYSCFMVVGCWFLVVVFVPPDASVKPTDAVIFLYVHRDSRHFGRLIDVAASSWRQQIQQHYSQLHHDQKYTQIKIIHHPWVFVDIFVCFSQNCFWWKTLVDLCKERYCCSPGVQQDPFEFRRCSRIVTDWCSIMERPWFLCQPQLDHPGSQYRHSFSPKVYKDFCQVWGVPCQHTNCSGFCCTQGPSGLVKWLRMTSAAVIFELELKPLMIPTTINDVVEIFHTVMFSNMYMYNYVYVYIYIPHFWNKYVILYINLSLIPEIHI